MFELQENTSRRCCTMALLLCLLPGCARFRLPAIDPSGDRIFLPAPSYTRLSAPPQSSILPRWPRPAYSAPADPPACPPPPAPAAYPAVQPVATYPADLDCEDDDDWDPPRLFQRWRPLSWDDEEEWQEDYEDQADPDDLCPPGSIPVYPAPYATPYGAPAPYAAPSYAATTYPAYQQAPLVPVYPQAAAPQAVTPQPPGIVRPDSVPQFPISPTPAPGPLIGESSRNGPPWSDQYAARLNLTPTQLVAPVGKEIVLRAGLCDSEGFLLKRQPIEWSLSQDSVGTIVEVDQNDSTWWRHMFHKAPQKQSGTYAVGLTSSDPQLLTQGTLDPNDDLWVLEGQTWVSVTSAAEGASHITAVAPTAAGWEDRRQTATIYWVDGRWSVPPTYITGAANGQTITSQVVRATSGTPVPGWRVRYEVVGGTPASLDANGSPAVEVATDSAGQATAFVTPQQPAGQTQVRVQVIRVGATPGDLPRYIVSDSVTTIQWTNVAGPAAPPTTIPTQPVPDLSTPAPTAPATPVLPIVQLSGPASTAVGVPFSVGISVTNPGTLPMSGVVLSNAIPNGAQYVSSSPAGDLSGNGITWQIGELQPNQTIRVTVNLQADAPGPLRDCASASTLQGTTGQGCVDIQVAGAIASSLDIQIEGPDTAQVGEQATFGITIMNIGSQPLFNVLVKDRFDPGLTHFRQNDLNELEFSMTQLAPGESRRVSLPFTIARPGRLCHTVQATSGDGSRVSKTACINVPEPGAGSYNPPTNPPDSSNPNVPPTFPPTTPPGTTPGYTPPTNIPGSDNAAASASPLDVQLQGPTSAAVGQSVTYDFVIINNSDLPQTAIGVTFQFDPALTPTDATEGNQLNGNQLRWFVPRLERNQPLRLAVKCQVTRPGNNLCCSAAAISAEGEQDQASTCLNAAPGAHVTPSPQSQQTFVAQRQPAQARLIAAATPSDETQPPASRPTAEDAHDSHYRKRPVTDPRFRIEITELGDPAIVGETMTYVVAIWNPRDQSDQAVALHVELPPQAHYHSSLNPPGISIRNRSDDGRQLDFLPINELRAHETAIYRIVVTPAVPGVGAIKLRVTSRHVPDGVTVSEETTFFHREGR